MVQRVAERKRPRDKINPRFCVEVYEEDAELIRRLKIAAVTAGKTAREWALEAFQEKLERGA